MINTEMIEIMGPALAAGLMIALTHAPLGLEVLKRGIIFIDLAVAQIAGLGLVVAGVVFDHPSGWAVQIFALVFAVSAGLFFRLVETHMPKQLEAIIGCSFVFASSLALLVLANQPHGTEEVQHMLSGQILFVTWQDIAKHAPVYAVILALWFLRPRVRQGRGFYLLFAMAITSSVQLVGVYMVFASLILPALAAVKVKHKHIASWSCGIVSILLGIIASVLSDLPAGPVIVVAYVVIAGLFNLVPNPVVLRKQLEQSDPS